MAEGRTVYGVTTGFGDLANVRIEPGPDRRAAAQPRPLRTPPASATRCRRTWCGPCCCCAPTPWPWGCPGVRPEVVELLVDMLNAAVHPVMPSRGSVGASGDLAPLAHLALVLIGEGEA